MASGAKSCLALPNDTTRSFGCANDDQLPTPAAADSGELGVVQTITQSSCMSQILNLDAPQKCWLGSCKFLCLPLNAPATNEQYDRPGSACGTVDGLGLQEWTSGGRHEGCLGLHAQVHAGCALPVAPDHLQSRLQIGCTRKPCGVLTHFGTASTGGGRVCLTQTPHMPPSGH